MARATRVNAGGYVYHALNRANGHSPIFENDGDYKDFEEILEEAVEKFNMRLLAYSLMPNHWHLVLYPREDGDLSTFMAWITNTHTRRWHAFRENDGDGHLYQGRFKSFICQDNEYLLTLIRYVERNPQKARLVKRAEEWRWGSVWRRIFGTAEHQKMLSPWPIDYPQGYLAFLNDPQTAEEEERIELSEKRSIPFGGETWVESTIKEFGLESTMRGRGRPKKGTAPFLR